MSHSRQELLDAGVLESDPQGVVDYKLEQRRRELSPFWNPPEIEQRNSHGWELKHFVIFAVLLAGYYAFCFVSDFVKNYPEWSRAREYQQADERASKERVSMKARRAQEFSDFSLISAWPSEVQRGYAKHVDKPLSEIVDELPLDFAKLPLAQQTELGAQVWFRISSKGSEAGQLLSELGSGTVRKRVRIRIGPALTASILFLRRQCTLGVEPACLDIAKAYASTLFEGIAGNGEEAIVKAALKELPETGPLAQSGQVVALKKRLAR